MTRTMLFVLLCLLAVPVLGQDASPAPFSEVEALRVQVVNLEGAILQRKVDDWEAKRAKLKADLEAARPGWRWNPETGQFTKAEPKQ